MKAVLRGVIAAASVVSFGLLVPRLSRKARRSRPISPRRTPSPIYNAGNLVSARSEFSRAAQKGSCLAKFNYAVMRLNGEGGPADIPEGKKWLRRAADANMAHTQYVYDKMYDDGEFVERDPTEAHRWFLRAANQGHVQAALALANQFLDERGTARDNTQAFPGTRKPRKAGT